MSLLGKIAHYAGEFSGFNDVKSFAEDPLNGHKALLAMLALGSLAPGGGVLAKAARYGAMGAGGILGAEAAKTAIQHPTNWRADLSAASAALPFVGGRVANKVFGHGVNMPGWASTTKRDWVSFQKQGAPDWENEFGLERRMAQLENVAAGRSRGLSRDAAAMYQRINAADRKGRLQSSEFDVNPTQLPPHLLTRAQFEADPRTLFHASYWKGSGSRVGLGELNRMEHAVHLGTPNAGYDRYGANNEARLNTAMINTTPDRVGSSLAADHPQSMGATSNDFMKEAIGRLPNVESRMGAVSRTTKALHDQEQYYLYNPAMQAIVAHRAGVPLNLRNHQQIKSFFDDPAIHARALDLIGRTYSPGETAALDNLFTKDAFPYLNNHEDLGNLSVMTHRSDLVNTHPDALIAAAKQGFPLEAMPGLKDYPSLRSELIRARAQGRLPNFTKLAPERLTKADAQRQIEVMFPDDLNQQVSDLVQPQASLGSMPLQSLLAQAAKQRFGRFIGNLEDNGVIRVHPRGTITLTNPADHVTMRRIRDELRALAKHGIDPHAYLSSY